MNPSVRFIEPVWVKRSGRRGISRSFFVRAAAAERVQAYSRSGVQVLRVLIAEDDLMIAGLLEDVLTASGYEVCGTAGTVDEAVLLGELHKPDLAVLDFRLARGGRGPEIARRLNSRGKFGVLYATGDAPRISKLTRADGEASITKPYRPEDLVRALEIVREIATGRTVTPPFPPGFCLLSEAAACFVQASPV